MFQKLNYSVLLFSEIKYSSIINATLISFPKLKQTFLILNKITEKFSCEKKFPLKEIFQLKYLNGNCSFFEFHMLKLICIF